MINADTPNLWEIRSGTDHATAVAIVVAALIHLARLVSLPKASNLSKPQIGEIANDVVEEYGHLKPEEIKYVLKQAVRENKIFGRLDYSVVMSWFKDYDAVRTEFCIDISSQAETQQANQPADDPDAISFEKYAAMLKQRAESGDKKAAELLADMEKISQQPRPLTDEQKHQKDVAFFRYFQEYLKSRKQP